MPLISEDVVLRIRGQWTGAEIQRGLRQLEAEVQRVGRTARNALSALLPGAGLGVAGGLALAVREAVKLAGEFEKMKLGLASILGSYGEVVDAQGRVLRGAERFNTLLRMSANLMTEIRKEADRTILETRELMEYVQSGLGFGLAKGLTQQQIVKLVSTIAVAGRTMGLPQGYPIVSEIRALLTGQNLRQSQIAQAVGITEAQLRSLSGEQFFRYITQQLRGFVDASNAFANSFEAQWSTFVSKIQEVLATLGEAIVPVLADFARDAARAIDEWKRTGGAERLKAYVREVLQSIVGIAQWLGSVAKWFKDNPAALRLARDIGAAAAGARVGALFGAKGAIAGAVVGGVGAELYDLLTPSAGVKEGERLERRMQSLLGKATGISAWHPEATSGGTRTGEKTSAVSATLRVRPMPPSPEALREAERKRKEAQAVAQRASEMSASLAVRRANSELQMALRNAEAVGWTPQAIAKVRTAFAEWKQASLREASARAAGEPTSIARLMIAEAQFEAAERQREIEDAIKRGQQQAAEASARQAEQQIEFLRQRVARMGGVPAHEALTEAFFSMMPLTARIASIPFAPVLQEMFRVSINAAQEREQQMSASIQRFASMMSTAAALEERRRAYSYQVYQAISGYGAPWTQAFGMAAPLAGTARLMLGTFNPIVQAMVDAVAEAQVRIREEWMQFWQDMATFSSNSIRDAFVRMTMDFMDNINRWEDALKDFVRSIRQMIQRAIAEWIYENYIKRGVESLLGGILGKAQSQNKRPSFGQVLGGVLLSGLVSWGLGQIFPAFFQHGGTAVAGRMAVVGERGPEIIVPGMTSAVIPAEAIARALARIETGSATPQMNIYVNHDGDLGLAQRVGREVERTLRRWRY